MLVVRRIYLKMELSSRQRKMLLFLTTDMFAMTSHTNQQFPTPETFGATISWDGLVGQVLVLIA